MMNIIELINNIPLLLSYFIPGYIFISCYRWTSFSNKNNDNALVCKSVVTSYIFVLFWKIVWKTDVLLDSQILFICLINLILGIFTGNFSKTEKCSTILSKLKIERTLCNNIWVETVTGNDYLRIFMDDGTSYMGLCKLLEESCREPIIILWYYQKLDIDGSVLIDHSEDPKEQIIINTKSVVRMELTKQKAVGF